MVYIDGLEKLPSCCRDCRLAVLIPFHNYRQDPRPKKVYRCFWTRQIDCQEAGDGGRLSECPLREKKKEE